MAVNTVFIEQLASAIEAGQALPGFPQGLSLEQGYSLQQQLCRRVYGGQVAGIKSGLSNPEIMAMLGLELPVLGALYAQREQLAGGRFEVKPNTSIECEIGIVVNARGEVVSAGPAIEFVSLELSNPGDFSAANLLAANLAADQFIRGPQSEWRASYDDIKVRLYRDEALLSSASVMDAMGGPHQALDWMLAESKRWDYKISDNLLLMTGICGDLVAAIPGHYRADYGSLGSVEFTITE